MNAPPSGPRSVMPKYYLVEQAIRRHIGTLEVGAALPPEQDLCRQYGVSRSTVRMAMDRLEQDGAIRRIQGRGTFVAATKLEYPLGYEPEGSVHRPGEDLPYHVLAVETPPAGVELASVFGIDPADPIVRVRRVAVHGHTVTAIDTLAVPLSINPSLPSADFRRGRLFFILADHGIKIVRNRLTIQSVIVDSAVAALLRVRPGVPAIQITRLGLDPTRHPVAHVDIVARGDIARYVIEAPVETGPAAPLEDISHV